MQEHEASLLAQAEQEDPVKTTDLTEPGGETSGCETPKLVLTDEATARSDQGCLIDVSESPVVELSLDTAVRRKASNLLLEHALQMHILIAGALLFLFFKFGFGAIFSVLCSTVVFFLLTTGRLATSRYNISSSQEGLVFVHNDWMGGYSLSCAWADIESIEETGQERIIIRLKEGILKGADRLRLPGLVQGKRPHLSLNAADFTDDKTRATFRELLDSKCRISKCEEAALPNAATTTGDAQSIVVDYNPHRVAQQKVRGWLKKTETLWIIALSLLTVFLIYKIGFSLTFVCLVLVVCGGLMIARSNMDSPSAVSFSEHGLSFNWKSSKSKSIPWSCVKRVSALRPSGRQTFDSTIDFYLADDPKFRTQIGSLKLLMPFFFAESKENVLRLRMGGLAGAQGRQDLLAALRKHLGDELVGLEVKELLNPTDPESYTTLWLSSLARDSQRSFEGALPVGYRLDNGKYEITRFIGAGGQASAYEAKVVRQTDAEVSDGPLVLKEFILPSHAGAEVSARSLAHIKSELELLQRIHNENIVEYKGLFVEDHRAYLVLEYIDGPSLRQLVETRGAMPEFSVLELATQMCEILQQLHSLSPPVVHRDFTPENLILAPSGKLKLIDFNVAQELETNATKTIVGKHAYIPPEQFRGKPCPQSDIYSLGATLFFLLTGQDPEAIRASHPILDAEHTSQKLDDLVARATQPELAKRFASAQELAQALKEIIASSSSQAELPTETDASESPAPSDDQPCDADLHQLESPPDSPASDEAHS